MAVAEKAKKLNKESVRGWLENRKGWKRRANKLTKEFVFTRFRASLVFVNRVATIADSCKHHPDMDVRGGTVILSLSTEEVGGITEKEMPMQVSNVAYYDKESKKGIRIGYSFLKDGTKIRINKTNKKELS